MWWRMTGPEFARRAGAGTKRALKRITGRRSPGLLAYDGRRPVGWCSVAPREEFMTRLERWAPFRRARDVLQNDAPASVWSVVCFFVDPEYRGRSVAAALLREAIRYAASRGAVILEAYPVDPAQRAVTSASAFVGTVPLFRRAGFREVVLSYPARPVMRRRLRPA
jgi:GNAT superfamily N-acetyltransferase